MNRQYAKNACAPCICVQEAHAFGLFILSFLTVSNKFAFDA